MSSAERLLYRLKSRGPLSARALARLVAMTEAGARQHLAKLEAEGLVEHADEAGRVGRPRRTWGLSDAGHARFPDTHGELTVSLIAAMRDAFGEEGLTRLIHARERAQRAEYKSALTSAEDLGGRVRALAKIRAAEGYMAQVRRERGGNYLLIENHCPICAAARACQGLCRSELAVFRAVLGAGVTIERIEHVLAGARRCAYRITPRNPKSSAASA